MEKSVLIRSFEMLGISVDATEKEVKSAFRRLSNQLHPDKENGNNDKQVELNKAYEIAKQAVESGTSLILIETALALENSNQALILQQEYQKTNLLVGQIKRHSTSGISSLRDFALVIGLISGVMALAKTNLLPISLDQNIKDSLGGVAFVFGFFAIFLQFIFTSAKNGIDDYLEHITDKNNCAQELARHLEYNDMEQFSENEYFNRQWRNMRESKLLYFMLFRSMSRSDKLKLLLQKSIELGLIENKNTTKIIPDQEKYYKLNQNFKPSLFKKEKHNKKSS